MAAALKMPPPGPKAEGERLEKSLWSGAISSWKDAPRAAAFSAEVEAEAEIGPPEPVVEVRGWALVLVSVDSPSRPPTREMKVRLAIDAG